jgi:enterochelin esterase-like enzyme
MARLRGIFWSIALASLPTSVAAQAVTEAPAIVPDAAKVQIELNKVRSASIAGNLLGTPADRNVYVVLPPSYAREPKRRYPVVYALHGFSIGADQWLKELHAPDTIQAAFAKGTPEMILVFPDSKNEYGGAFYSSSPVTGDFESFVADELIDYIDRKYRTIASPEARGLVGHSMGGYGAARIGIRHAERYGALYLMSACCLAPLGTQGLDSADAKVLGKLPDIASAKGLPFKQIGALALGAAFSPNPNKPPFYIDLPIDEDGKERPEILAKRTANAPIAFLDQYAVKLRHYRAIAVDVGDQDSLVADARKMHEALDAYRIPNSLDIYAGTHISRVAFRLQDHVLPFFGRTLSTRLKTR